MTHVLHVIVVSMPDDALGQLATALNQLYRLSGSARFHDETVRATGVAITRSGLRFLTLVADSGPLSGTRLAAGLDLSQPTASRVLQQLETDRLVSRQSAPNDGRVTHYVVTAQGKRTLAKVHAFHISRLAAALHGAHPQRQADLAGAVTELVSRLRSDDVDAPAAGATRPTPRRAT